jgi:3-methyl-2-oxobutanoate hydroxymethyltransferase
VLVVNDLLGMDETFAPRFVKRYAELGRAMADAIAAYAGDVRAGSFPDPDHSYSSE